jgi:predicted dehydrogenase
MAEQDAPTRWGIIGTGWIAAAFAADLALLPDARLVAVGSRNAATADAFGDRYEVPRRYASYEELVADDEVDAVYVSTPHPMHHPNTLLAIRAGKAVLVEKPFTINAAEAAELIEAARSQGTFLMEAMWTRFLPHVVKVRELVAQGALGDVRSLTADHGQWFAKDPSHRLFAPELGGGALLDLGVYVVSFASMLFGTPAKVTAVSDPAFTGVDAQTGMLLQYAGGEHAVLFTTLETLSANRASINGTQARIEIDGPFYTPRAFRLVQRDGSPEEFDLPFEGRGMQYQAAEVGRCLREGRTESTVMPLDETLSIMQTMDDVRRQIGLRYPTEVPA